MTPKIVSIQDKIMVGMRLSMSLVNNKTGDLFRSFMPRKNEITHKMSDGVYALQQYDFNTFTPQTVFEKWACVEVSSIDQLPDKMETFTLKSGLYAMFTHKGTTADFRKTMHFILEVWQPKSGYEIDNNRPHFEYLTTDYLGPNNPDSEEEVWIPIQ